MKFLADLFKPLLTILVTIVGLAFLASVLSPRADDVIESWVPLWATVEPAENMVRGWLGLHETAEPSWWHFWGRN
ncbi:hypothetical protein [Maricaulis sp.]|jgi:hypothetical protein|uniref:hypothetical protein n=1 Tax=Maricaulis sp. TaxID=1486257 RepID=UPI0025E67BBB|nr:hypothetical protein [Maricaulis sp.]MDF1768663.1 hypothetical protein [Maricaulis sp.]